MTKTKLITSIISHLNAPVEVMTKALRKMTVDEVEILNDLIKSAVGKAEFCQECRSDTLPYCVCGRSFNHEGECNVLKENCERHG